MSRKQKQGDTQEGRVWVAGKAATGEGNGFIFSMTAVPVDFVEACARISGVESNPD